MAGYAYGIGSTGVLYGDRFHDDLRRDDPVQPDVGPAHKKIRNENRNGRKRFFYSRRPVWLFILNTVLDADRFCGSVWIGSGSHRRGAQ